MSSESARSIWAHDNLVAWEAAPYDTKKRSSEDRAKMLKRLGFNHYAYLSSTDPWGGTLDDVNTSQHDVDAEIEAMQKHGINITAWYFWLNGNDPAEVPTIRDTLEAFKRHNINPQIWMTHSHAYFPKTSQGWAKLLPPKVMLPKKPDKYENLSSTEKRAIEEAYARIEINNFPKTLEEQKNRVREEADRINAFVKLAAPYGCRVNIYNHRGWFGMMENQLAILHYLEGMDVKDVGMVYNFHHSRDRLHDDSKTFPRLWEKIRLRVVTVNVIGIWGTNGYGFPSQGDRELAMMRIIQESGWRGKVGVLVPGFGDTELKLRNSVIGINWIAAELRQPGSAGPRPFGSGA